MLDQPLAYSLDKAAQLSGRSRRQLYRHIESGALIARKDGFRTIVLADDLRAWLDALPRLKPSAGGQQ
ncbi:helix-turn-helix domain-containing protein [Ferrovibrio terrae]|uniref:Helix-turn-helix domain-containing protein n=1 Tax=Ferrovibrio terrae TaxID=2594003 RepID=A0A516H5Q7_9PROT|nr:helix-turn-helix domain-containing protein [Ferrovibrio terrae]QDO99096.1 helix-turn-helix domain-containing protein [Ferrovibrio terrae]